MFVTINQALVLAAVDIVTTSGEIQSISVGQSNFVSMLVQLDKWVQFQFQRAHPS